MMTENRPELPLSALVKDNLQKKGIKYGLFDVDGTLLDTHGFYDAYMTRFAHAISSFSPHEAETPEVLGFMFEVLNGLRPQFSVDPTLMTETARLTALRFGQDFYSDKVQKESGKLMELYSGIPPAFEGVYETLDVLKKSELEMAAVTHSDDAWSRTKLAKNGLLGFFNAGIFTFNTLGPKGVEQWQSVMESLSARPEEVLIVGDNIISDIDPNLFLGVPPGQIYRIDTDYSDANLGQLDPRVKQLKKFEYLPYAVMDMAY